MLHKIVRIGYADGLRSRPAAAFTTVASRYSSKILLEFGNMKINAKSIMGVLSLGVKEGDKVHIFASGEDEKEALEVLTELIEKG